MHWNQIKIMGATWHTLLLQEENSKPKKVQTSYQIQLQIHIIEW